MAGLSTMMGNLVGMLASRRGNSRLGPSRGIWLPRWCWRTLHILAWSPWKRIRPCWSLFWSGLHRGQTEMATKICREAKSAENTNSWGSISLSADPLPLTPEPGWFVSSGFSLVVQYLISLPELKRSNCINGRFVLFFSQSLCKKILWFLPESSYKLWILLVRLNCCTSGL